MERWLSNAGIEYVWMGDGLGGWRKRGLGTSSPNLGWSSPGFRNYADHTLTEDFRAAVEELMLLALARTTCFMCAERHYFRCHRRILSDYLACRGWRVIHIVDAKTVVEHRLTSFARLRDGVLVYPPPEKETAGSLRKRPRKTDRASAL